MNKNNFTSLAILLFLTGCSSTSIPIVNRQCPSQPQGTLESENVQKVEIDGQGIDISGKLKFGQYLGYIFEGKSDRVLKYDTPNDICLWLYDPEMNLLETFQFKQNGIYTLQVSTPQGSTSFDLSLSIAGKGGEIILYEDDAIAIVNKWLASKSSIFSPPFDESLVSQLTTGERYQDITKPNGSIDWLRRNNSYYKYRASEIKKVISFSDSSQYPELKITIYEDLTLYGPRGIDYENSGSSTRDYIYYFALDNGIWKIYDAKLLD
ncbi:ARC6/PARC6 family protein [Spirulina sp. 06S082]|uniref:ARC6/PARC6 family protein n=1 Tax=Spirulina sp. 06S082 TaxID=3110248 RepID=UPI002B2007F5|nr:ARC6/PARC6 family protein [Spirulina sp. 06S082]MEA5470377.1 ARC6/PARC6 family protein [Spirulina sp. 06S082]